MRQEKKAFHKEIIKHLHLNYLLYLPEDYESIDKKWPLVLFLHGAGECGDDLEVVKRNGIPRIADEGGSFQFVAVSPQCPDGSAWENHFEDLDLLLDEIIDNYKIDEDRVYATGLSMGGYGTWDIAIVFPERFAAIVPVCGGTIYPELVNSLKDLPVWAFHGAKDDIVPVEETRTIVDILKENGGNVRYTEYPDAGHDSWTETYNNPEVYKWLLSQRRNRNKPQR
jgi:predicted peptidase